jgi:regulator of sirC expression with transglutaminase-like and TPR domain
MRRNSRIINISLLVLTGLFSVAVADDPPEASPEANATKEVATDEVTTDEEIAKLIELLGSDSFPEREAAAKRLAQIGRPARSRLKAAKENPSVEIRSRAARLLRNLDVVPLETAFEELARQPDETIDLEQGMWLISRILNPDVQREELTKPLDRLAAKVREKLGKDVVPKSVDPQRVVSVMQHVLFEEEQFRGNVDDYGNPKNSSLADVLSTKKGLPILLSHVVVSVAERLEVPIVGVPTPGRYIVKYDGRRAPTGFPQTDVYLSPFDGGKVLSRADLKLLFPGLDADQMVAPGSRRDVLIRMLNNIETHLFNRDEIDRAYLAVAFRVALQDHAVDSDG